MTFYNLPDPTVLDEEETGVIEVEPCGRLLTFALGMVGLFCFLTIIGSI